MTASEAVLSSNAAAAAVLSGAEDCRIGGMVRHLFEILRLWLGTGIPPSPYKTIQIEIRVHNFGKTNRVRILPVAPAQSIYASPGGSGTAPAGAALLLLTAFSSASEKLVVKASHAAVKPSTQDDKKSHSGRSRSAAPARIQNGTLRLQEDSGTGHLRERGSGDAQGRRTALRHQDHRPKVTVSRRS